MTGFSLLPLTPISFSPAIQTQAAISQAASQRPQLLIVSPNPGEEFHIDQTPQMPSIPCEAKITRLTPDPTSTATFNWSITVREVVTPGGCPCSQIGTCQTGEQASTGARWTPAFRVIQGGDAEITVTTTIDGSELSAAMKIKILGTDPDFATQVAALGGKGSVGNQIACWESDHHQFVVQGMPEPYDKDVPGMPLEGKERSKEGAPPGFDVGIMQLCSTKSCAQRWDWRENVRSGLALFATETRNASNYLSIHAIKGGKQKYPNDQGLSDQDVIRYEAIQRYNSVHSYWTWDADAGQWITDPPINPRTNKPSTYVTDVLNCKKRTS